MAEGQPAPTLTPAVSDLVTLLGAPKFARERVVPLLAPGVVNGLAWTAVGGSVLHIEAARYKGKGALRLTGRLGGGDAGVVAGGAHRPARAPR